MVPNGAFVATIRQLEGRNRIIVGCRSGGRSAQAARALRANGMNVVEQRAGTHGVRDAFGAIVEEGWLDAGLPVDRGPAPQR